MSRSQNSFIKRQRAMKKLKKKKEKFEQKLERSKAKKEDKENAIDGKEAIPMGYVDKFGNVVTSGHD